MNIIDKHIKHSTQRVCFQDISCIPVELQLCLFYATYAAL